MPCCWKCVLRPLNTVICPGDAVPPILSMICPPCPSALSGPEKISPPQQSAPRAAAAGISLARMRASQQRAARLGRQPVDAGARGEAKDAQEVVFSKWRRRRHVEVLLPFTQ